MTDHFVLRPDREGFTVLDVLTGRPAMLAGMPQTGLSQKDAAHTAELLNQRADEAQGVAQPG
jgi:hypothetical protein